MSALQVGEDHPLALEIASLRAAVARYQHEAHTASVKLQRHSLDTSHALDQSHALQRQNSRLQEEIESLRENPDVTPDPTAQQVSELTLALRRLSDKLTAIEETLADRTTELAHARSDLAKVQPDIAAANDLASQSRLQVQEARARERELQRKVQVAEEERRLSDLVVQEYADLVRTLEGRKSKSTPPLASVDSSASSSSTTLADSLAEGKLGLQKLLGEHGGEAEHLASEVTRLHGENELLKAKLDVERNRSEADRESLARVLLDLDKYKADDSTATKMVSRYMKFSQSTIDSLQQAMDNLRTRNNATLTTLRSQIDQLHKALTAERTEADKLRDILDDVSEDISRESYGRRREVALRLAFLSREEALAEGLRRWLRKSKETLGRCAEHSDGESDLRQVFEKVVQDAEGLLETLNGQPSAENPTPGTVARLVAAQDAVSTLTRELQAETDRRLRLQQKLLAFKTAEDSTGYRSLDEIPALPTRHASLTNPVMEGKEGKASDAMKSVDLSRPPHSIQSSVEAFPVIQPVDKLPAVVESEQVAASDEVILPTGRTSQESESTSVSSHEPSATTPHNVELVDESTATEPETLQSANLAHRDQEIQSGVENELEAPPAIQPVPALDFEEVQARAAPSADELTTFDTVATISEQTSPLTGLQPMPTALVPFPSSPESTPATTIDTEQSATSSPHIPSVDVPEDLQIHPQPELSMLFGQSAAPSPLAGTPRALFSPPPRNPLLGELFQVKYRYDVLQKSFRDCNLTLKDLKKDLGLIPPSGEMLSVVKTAVERLDDYNEDARVELEIRVADEERILAGYETLLSVSGALSEDMDETELEQEIKAFIDGSDKSVAKAMQQFTRKLDDLQHDIASIKRALHDLASDADGPLSAQTTPSKSSQGWSSWILGGSASRPVSPAPTFGSVMTTPRLRQASFSFMHRPNAPHDLDLGSPRANIDDPFASLGLRVPMPAPVAPSPAPSRHPGMFLAPAGMGPRVLKGRASSASMYMLGFGGRSSSLGLGISAPTKPIPTSGLIRKSEQSDTSSNSEAGAKAGAAAEADTDDVE